MLELKFCSFFLLLILFAASSHCFLQCNCSSFRLLSLLHCTIVPCFDVCFGFYILNLLLRYCNVFTVSNTEAVSLSLLNIIVTCFVAVECHSAYS